MIVWLASYPRSGNTFLRVIFNKVFNVQTYSIYDDNIDIASDTQTSEVVGHQSLPEDFDISIARSEEKVYYIKTHELPSRCVEDGDKVIYLIRDGRECALSYLRYEQSYGDKGKTLEDTIYGNIFSSGWGDHVKAWSPKLRENTLLIKFEELTGQPENYIKIISNFLGLKSSGEKIPLFSELNRINPKFFRSGKINSWKEVFSENEVLAFWFKNYTQMLEYGYVDDVPEIIGSHSSFLLFKQLSSENSYLLKEVLHLRDKHKVISKLEKQIDYIESLTERELNESKRKLAERDKIIQDQGNELGVIKNSKRYKLLTKVSKFLSFR